MGLLTLSSLLICSSITRLPERDKQKVFLDPSLCYQLLARAFPFILSENGFIHGYFAAVFFLGLVLDDQVKKNWKVGSAWLIITCTGT